MTNSFVLHPTKLVSVEPDGANARGVVAFRDYKGTVHQLDFAAYGETAKKLLQAKIGSKFEADGSIDIFKEADYLTVFFISAISAIKPPDPNEEEQALATEPVKTPVKAIAPKAGAKPTPPEGNLDIDPEDIPF